MSSFFGLNVALTALRANQYAMDVTGHNIANANTEGYRRQEVLFTANHPYTSKLMGSATTITQLGTGVDVADVRRTQTDFLDTQVRMETQLFGMWSSRNEALEQIEPLLSEPSDAGLSAAMDKFWNAWQNLAATPESTAARTTVVASATAMSGQIRNLYENMGALQRSVDAQIAGSASEINGLLEEIANINSMTVRTDTGQYAPNDLIDRRDLLIEKLSNILKIEVHGTAGSNLIISAGGRALVQGNWHAQIEAQAQPDGWTKLMLANENTELAVDGGRVKGLIDVRDTLIGGYMDSLDNITRTIVDRVNAIHATGFDASGNPCGLFFEAGTGAADIRVHSAILADHRLVGSSGTAGAAGDNAMATSMANIRKELLIGNQTTGEAYVALVARIGAHAKEAAVQSEAHEFTMDQRKSQRDSVAGVSLDEEMSNMVRFQQAYNAAARIFSALDEMLDTIISAV